MFKALDFARRMIAASLKAHLLHSIFHFTFCGFEKKEDLEFF